MEMNSTVTASDFVSPNIIATSEFYNSLRTELIVSKFICILFAEAKANAPSVIFFDEVDGILSRLTQAESNLIKRVQCILKSEWRQAMEKSVQVIVVGATNNSWDIDMNDFGRQFDAKYYVDLPDRMASGVF
ncbi:MAG: Vacuolar protein sorting-associated protein 4 [Cirrosporium novae-zelandiae]|nr:MAG: Vacuolar protein sorting-associated protein 4 [Cirrosporium novae-zelandiae]